MTKTPSGGAAQHITFGYDNDGNQTTITPPAGPAVTYTFDAEGRVTAAGDRTYGHDTAGNRTSITNGGQTTTLTWDPVGHANPMIATETAPTGSTDLRYEPSGRILSAHNPTTGDADWYHHDWLDSLTDATNNSGAHWWRNSFDAFGTATASEGVGAGTTRGPPSFGYTGAYRLDTGDYHLRDRDYRPTTGSFLSRDPIGYPADTSATSRYAYVNGRVTTDTDPSGLCPMCVSALVGAGIGAVVGGVSYAVTHEGGWNWNDFGRETGKGVLIGLGAGLLMPAAGGAAVAVTGLRGGAALTVEIGVNASVGAGYTWAVNELQCKETTWTDLLLGGLGGGGSTAVPRIVSKFSGASGAQAQSATARVASKNWNSHHDLPTMGSCIRRSRPCCPQVIGSTVSVRTGASSSLKWALPGRREQCASGRRNGTRCGIFSIQAP